MNGVSISEKSSPPPSSSPPTQRRRPLLPTPNGSTSSKSYHRRYSSSSSPDTITHIWWRARRILTKPLAWILGVLFILIVLWGNGSMGGELQGSELQERLKDLLPPEVTKNLQFFPASHHMIHVRCTSQDLHTAKPRGSHADCLSIVRGPMVYCAEQTTH